MQAHLASTLAEVENAGLWKYERSITSPQQAHVHVDGGDEVLNLCANNYLGLADHPDIVAAAHRALDERGFGLASVRFICGTQDIHKTLEQKLASFLGTDDAILYSSCFDANAGLFETLLGPEDAVLSDQLNHASVIDGIRLCKAGRYRYAHSDMADLEAKLKEADQAGARFKLIATDGVFSMDGDIAKLDAICDLADRYEAQVMVDDSHATGFLGGNGKGTHEYCNVLDRVDIITSTLGKALGGASGGFTAARQEIVQLLRQRSRPYLFSNSVAPPIVATAMTALDLIQQSSELKDQLWRNTAHFREGMKQRGFDITEGIHPIVPIMIGDANKANDMAHQLFEAGVYVVGFSYPVVPKGQARIRVQLSAAHTEADIEQAMDAFARIANTGAVH
jgi:glycine C-acetyltransferase